MRKDLDTMIEDLGKPTRILHTKQTTIFVNKTMGMCFKSICKCKRDGASLKISYIFKINICM